MAYIVNHGGVVHSVPDEQLNVYLGVASVPPTQENPSGKPARMASDEEIDAWYKSQGLPNPHAPAPAPSAPRGKQSSQDKQSDADK